MSPRPTRNVGRGISFFKSTAAVKLTVCALLGWPRTDANQFELALASFSSLVEKDQRGAESSKCVERRPAQGCAYAIFKRPRCSTPQRRRSRRAPSVTAAAKPLAQLRRKGATASRIRHEYGRAAVAALPTPSLLSKLLSQRGKHRLPSAIRSGWGLYRTGCRKSSHPGRFSPRRARPCRSHPDGCSGTGRCW